MDSKHRLFVYGTLRSGFHSEAYKYVAEHFTFLGMGKVKGKLHFDGNKAYAIPSLDNNYIVGELYELNHPEDYSWVFGQLDDYEGLHVMPGESPAYRREPVKVELNNTVLYSWIYWYNYAVDGMITIPSGDLLQYLQSINK